MIEQALALNLGKLNLKPAEQIAFAHSVVDYLLLWEKPRGMFYTFEAERRAIWAALARLA